MAGTIQSKCSVSPLLPFKTRMTVAALSAITDFCRRSNGTINRLVFNFFDLKSAPNPTPTHNVRTADVPIDPSRNLWLRLFIPTAAAANQTLPLIVFFHGGGFAFLSPASAVYDATCRRIARVVPAVVASVNYRLTPEHRYPAQYDDGVDTLRFLDAGRLAEFHPDVHFDLERCFLMGDSAGANIAHHVAARWAAGEWGRVRVAGVVSIQPWFGGEERTEAEMRLAGAPLVPTEWTDWLWRVFLPEGADRDHEAANVFGPRSAALPVGFPAVAVVVGGYDPLQDWQRRYYNGLKSRGVEAKLVEFPDDIHAFYLFPELPSSGRLVNVLREFMGNVSSK